MSNAWRKISCSLVICLLWSTKNRAGVVTNMTIGEWQDRQERAGSVVIVVAKHKTGDRVPATLVIDKDMEDLMER